MMITQHSKQFCLFTASLENKYDNGNDKMLLLLEIIWFKKKL